MPVRTALARWRPRSGCSSASLRIAARTRYVTAVRARSALDPVVRARPPSPNASLSCSTSASSSSSARSARPLVVVGAGLVDLALQVDDARLVGLARARRRAPGRRLRRRPEPPISSSACTSTPGRASRIGEVARCPSCRGREPCVRRTRPATSRPRRRARVRRRRSPACARRGAALARRRCPTRDRARSGPAQRVDEVDADRWRRGAGHQLRHRVREQLGQHGDRRRPRHGGEQHGRLRPARRGAGRRPLPCAA